MEVLRLGYRIPFARVPPLSQEPIPMPSYAPMSTTLAIIAKGAVELAPLPSPGFYSRLFVVWKTSGSWHPVIDLSRLQRFSRFFSFQDGDHPGRPSVSSSGGLDSFHRLEGGLLAGPCSSRLSQVSTVCGFWPSISIPSSLLQSRLGPSGLHQGYGSGFVDPALHGYPSTSLSRRLADPVSFSRGCSSRPPCGHQSVSGAGDCGESREVQLRSVAEGSISGDDPGLPVFCGFSVPGSDHQAAVSRWRISVLRSTASLLLAVSSRHPVLSVLSCSGGQASHAVTPVSATPILGSPRRLGSHCLDSPLSPRPPLVVRQVSSV